MQNLENCALFEFSISFQIIYAVNQENYGFKSYPTVCFEKLLGDKDILFYHETFQDIQI